MSGSTEADVRLNPASDRPAAHLVIGLGASAGGLEAYKEFFSRMPPDLGMSCILVQHLDPHYESALASIVATYTAMPVEPAADGVRVEPNRVYVIPSDAILTIRNGTLRLTSPASPASRRTSINTFLTSLAEDKGEDAIGIILSGFGSDGSLGIAAIKEHGGLTLSQAEYDHHAKSGMPQSAASGGSVDYVLAAADMPAALIAYRRNRMACDAAKDPDGLRGDLRSQLPAFCTLLYASLGRDFSQYKPGTLIRRIQRRMHVRQTDQVPDYLEQLRTRPEEAELLFHELLIGVTRFFRDGDTFGEVETRILPGLLADLPGGEPIRVWVAGCATGEEAYTMAILLKEALAASGRPRTVQVFATDIDARAIDVARAGLYEAPIVADLSPERLERHFLKEDGRYRIAKDLREMCLFSVHDLIKDPPLSRLDLVTCRNLMIYFDTELQGRVLTTFHYALRSDRFLLLGSSESVGAGSHLFEPLDRRRRIFVRREAAATLPRVSAASWAASWAEGRGPTRPPSRQMHDDIDRRAARAMAQYAPAFLRGRPAGQHPPLLRPDREIPGAGDGGRQPQPVQPAACRPAPGGARCPGAGRRHRQAGAARGGHHRPRTATRADHADRRAAAAGRRRGAVPGRVPGGRPGTGPGRDTRRGGCRISSQQGRRGDQGLGAVSCASPASGCATPTRRLNPSPRRCSPPTRSTCRSTRSCSRQTRNWKPPKRSSSPSTKSCRPSTPS